MAAPLVVSLSVVPERNANILSVTTSLPGPSTIALAQEGEVAIEENLGREKGISDREYGTDSGDNGTRALLTVGRWAAQRLAERRLGC